MPLETEKTQIDGLTVTVQQFAGRKNFDVLMELAQVAGPTLGSAAGNAKGGNLMDMDIDISKVADTLFRSMDSARVRKLVRDMLESTYVDDRCLSEDVEFDRVFAGPHIWRLPKILAFVVRVNFGNFSELAGSVSSLPGGSQADQAPVN